MKDLSAAHGSPWARLRSALQHRPRAFLLLEALGLAILAADAAVLVRLFLVPHSLWVDEAMLGYALFHRASFFVTSADMLTWNQSAPVLYIYAVKLLALVFGRAEWVVRLPAALAYAGTAALSFLLLRRALRFPYPLLGTACVTNVFYFLRYAVEFKPYEGDGFCVLLAVYLYWLYRTGKLKAPVLAGCFAVLVWASNPVCFFAGAAAAYEVLGGLCRKDRPRALRGLAVGLVLCASFAAYYLYWLKPILDAGEMTSYWTETAYWKETSFPLFPTSIAKVKLARDMIVFLLSPFGHAWKPAAFLALIGAAGSCFYRRNAAVSVFTLGGFITLLASWAGFFPIAQRLYVFILPVVMLLALHGAQWLLSLPWARLQQAAGVRAAALGALLMFCAWAGNGAQLYADSAAILSDTDEANANISYVESAIQPDETLYVFRRAVPVFTFKQGYDTAVIGAVKAPVLLGGSYFDGGQGRSEIAAVAALDKAYILATRISPDTFTPLVDALRASGSFELVRSVHRTPLYYYAKDPADAKGAYALTAGDTADDEAAGICTAAVTVSAEGAYLNSGYDTVYLEARAADGTVCGVQPVTENAAPGQPLACTISFAWGKETRVSLQLVKNGKDAAAAVTIAR